MSNITKVTLIVFLIRLHFYIHVYSLYMQSLGLTLFQVSSIETIVIVMVFLAEVPTGMIGDRFGQKWALVLSTFMLMSAEFLFLFSRSYGLFVVVALLTGIGHAASSGAAEALVYDSLPPENREDGMKRAMGRINSAGQIAFFLSPIIGGVIVSELVLERFALAIVLTVLALLAGVVISLSLKPLTEDISTDPPDSWGILKNGLGELRGSAALRRITLLVVFTTPFTGVLIGTLAAPYQAANGVNPTMIGVALSVGSLLAAVTQHYAYVIERWLGQRAGIVVLTMLPGVFYWALAAASGSVAVFGIVVLMYALNDTRAPLLSAYQNTHIRGRSRATILSLINMLVNLFIAAMGLAYGALATYSLPLAFVVMGAVILVAALALRVDRLPVQMGVNQENASD